MLTKIRFGNVVVPIRVWIAHSGYRLLPRSSWVCKVDAPKKTKNLKATFPCHAQQPDTDQAGEQIINGVMVESIASRPADLASRHAGLPSLSNELHDEIGCWNMVTPLPIPVMKPRVT